MAMRTQIVLLRLMSSPPSPHPMQNSLCHLMASARTGSNVEQVFIEMANRMPEVAAPAPEAVSMPDCLVTSDSVAFF